MKELRRQIERVVRPIKASQWRKDRMREELLAHLGALYAEELAAAAGDHSRALSLAAARFGDPSALTAELQATVPIIERIGCTPLPGARWQALRPGETQAQLVRRRLRMMLWATAINSVIWLGLLAAILLGVARKPRPFDPIKFTTLVLTYITIFPLFTSGLPLLCDQLQRDWRTLREAKGISRRWIMARIIGCAVAAGSLFPATMLSLMLLLEWNLSSPLFPGTSYWVVYAVLSVTGVLLALLSARDARRYEEWGSLELEGAIETTE